jgi:CRISPR-associated protein Csd1
MILQALYQYAKSANLLDELPFQNRPLHLLVSLRKSGELRSNGLVLLTTTVTEKNKTKEVIGREYLLPRFPGENNGGKAYYLAADVATVFGFRKESEDKNGKQKQVGQPLPLEPKDRQDRNPVLAHRHFWTRIETAFERTKDERLRTLLAFRDRYLDNDTQLFRGLPFFEIRQLPKAAKPELCVQTESGTWQPVKKANTVSFQIEGQFIFPSGESEDPLWKDWAETYRQEAYAEPASSGKLTDSSKQQTVCLITGQCGEPVARSHKPTITGVPGLSSGGYVVSFATEAPAFSSYGFRMGENAPVSENAAASYALALNQLLSHEDTSFRVGEVVFCFWAEKQSKPASLTWSKFSVANPKSVVEFLKTPFSGIDQELARREQFFSVALSGNAGRVVVRDWIQVMLERAVINLHQWFTDLEVAALVSDEAKESEDGKSGPYSIFRLAAALVRDAKELKRLSEVVSELYRSALLGLPLSISLLEPVLAEFRSALVTDNPKKPRYPFNCSRFALIKLILTRHRGAFMPTPVLSDTDDPAYNLGRLLCVLSSLQDKAHAFKLEGPGIVEKYYGAASSTPATVFAILWKLHNHHLRKVEQQGEEGLKAAFAIRGRIAEITSKFSSAAPKLPPKFPKQLTLEEQGRFALGFYQQLAADRQAIRDARKE